MRQRTKSLHFALAIAAVSVALAASPASAQSDFAGLSLKPGDVVYVTEAGGVEVGGALTSISTSLLTIDGYRFEPADVAKIERRGDSLWNGLLIGLAVGAGLGGLVAALGDCVAVECEKGPILLAPAFVYGAIGAFIDWRHQGRTVVFRAPPARGAQLVPWVGSRRAGIGFVAAF